MKVILLGGAGFGGAGLTRRLVKKGYYPTILDITAPRQAVLIRDLVEADKIEYIWKSTHDLVPNDFNGFDTVIDLAAQADVPLGFSSPIYTAQNNILSVYKIMECLKHSQIKKFIYMGSGTTFGPNQDLPIGESAPQYASNPYSASKHCAEIVSMAYHRSHNIPVTILRNGIVYGEQMRHEIVVATFIINALLGRPLEIHGGDQTRDINYVSNTLDALELVIEAEAEVLNGEIFHCATGVETSISELAKSVLKLTGSSSSIENKPYREGEVNVRQKLDFSKANRILGYKPKVFLEEGLKRTIEWFKKEINYIIHPPK